MVIISTKLQTHHVTTVSADSSIQTRQYVATISAELQIHLDVAELQTRLHVATISAELHTQQPLATISAELQTQQLVATIAIVEKDGRKHIGIVPQR